MKGKPENKLYYTVKSEKFNLETIDTSKIQHIESIIKNSVYDITNHLLRLEIEYKTKPGKKKILFRFHNIENIVKDFGVQNIDQLLEKEMVCHIYKNEIENRSYIVAISAYQP